MNSKNRDQSHAFLLDHNHANCQAQNLISSKWVAYEKYQNPIHVLYIYVRKGVMKSAILKNWLTFILLGLILKTVQHFFSLIKTAQFDLNF